MIQLEIPVMTCHSNFYAPLNLTESSPDNKSLTAFVVWWNDGLSAQYFLLPIYPSYPT
jgi:hypothetical protein